MENFKVCTKCKTEKGYPVHFPAKGMVCKTCGAEKSRKYYQNNKEKHNENSRKWVKLNPDKRRAALKRYYSKNSNLIIDNSRKYRINNPEWSKRNAKERRERMSDGIVRYYLIKEGFDTDSITPKLIEQKRFGVKINRKIKQIKTTIKQKTKS
jgi:hypothetical protein